MRRIPLLLSLIAISAFTGCSQQIASSSVDAPASKTHKKPLRHSPPVLVDSRLVHLLPGAPPGTGNVIGKPDAPSAQSAARQGGQRQATMGDSGKAMPSFRDGMNRDLPWDA